MPKLTLGVNNGRPNKIHNTQGDNASDKEVKALHHYQLAKFSLKHTIYTLTLTYKRLCKINN